MKRAYFVLGLLALLAVSPAAAVDNTALVPLGDFQLSGPQVQTGVPNTGLQGLTAASCQARFFYGSGGIQANVYIQTSLDQGQSWFDVANIKFTTASALAIVNLSGLAPVTTPAAPANQGLPDNTTFNGPLGDRLQAVVVSQGTYAAGTLLSVRCAPR